MVRLYLPCKLLWKNKYYWRLQESKNLLNHVNIRLLPHYLFQVNHMGVTRKRDNYYRLYLCKKLRLILLWAVFTLSIPQPAIKVMYVTSLADMETLCSMPFWLPSARGSPGVMNLRGSLRYYYVWDAVLPAPNLLLRWIGSPHWRVVAMRRTPLARLRSSGWMTVCMIWRMNNIVWSMYAVVLH